MKHGRVFLFDLYLLFSLFTVLTGAYLIPLEWIQWFGTHPKAYRSFVSTVSISWVVTAALLHWRGSIQKHSAIIPFIANTNAKIWLWSIFLYSAATLAYSSFMRHHVFHSGFDFAIFAQAIWNTWHGNFLYSSIKGGICLLGDHVSPILIFLAPLYGVLDDPAVLLIYQAVVAASSVFPIFFIARKLLGRSPIPLIFAAAFACYAPLRNAVRFDFHPELAGDPLILWAFYFILDKKLAVASIFLFFVLLTKETACAPVAMLSLYCWRACRHRFFGIAWFAIAVSVFFFDVKVIAPFLSGQEYAYLSGNYLKWKDEGLAAFLSHLFQASTFTYIKKMFFPLGFFSFLSPSTFLLTLPTLVQNLTATGSSTRSTYFQYTTFLTPFVFISAIHGFRRFLEWAKRQRIMDFQKCSRVAAYWLLGSSLLMVGGSEVRIIAEYQKENNEHYDYIRKFMRTIPSDVSVRTHEFFAPHMAQRKELHIYENGHPREGGSVRAQNADYVVIDRRFLKKEIDADQELASLKARGYRVDHEVNGFYVLKKVN